MHHLDRLRPANFAKAEQAIGRAAIYAIHAPFGGVGGLFDFPSAADIDARRDRDQYDIVIRRVVCAIWILLLRARRAEVTAALSGLIDALRGPRLRARSREALYYVGLVFRRM